VPESPRRRRKQRSAPTAATEGATPVLRRRKRELTTDQAIKASNRITPRWWVVTMIALMVLGLVWVVTFYLSSSQYPVPGWDNWNLLAGFGLIIVGFAMTTRWR
jgi:hypothetical protein